jgi:hypothetical protein
MADAGTDDINKARCADPGPDPEGTLEKNHLLGAGRPGELIARRWALRMDATNGRYSLSVHATCQLFNISNFHWNF